LNPIAAVFAFRTKSLKVVICIN